MYVYISKSVRKTLNDSLIILAFLGEGQRGMKILKKL